MQINGVLNVCNIKCTNPNRNVKKAPNFTSLQNDDKNFCNLQNLQNINFDSKNTLISQANKLFIQADEVKKLSYEKLDEDNGARIITSYFVGDKERNCEYSEVYDENLNLVKKVIQNENGVKEIFCYDPETKVDSSYSYLSGKLLSASFSDGDEVKTFSYSWGDELLRKVEIRTKEDKTGEVLKTFNYEPMGNFKNVSVKHGDGK